MHVRTCLVSALLATALMTPYGAVTAPAEATTGPAPADLSTGGASTTDRCSPTVGINGFDDSLDGTVLDGMPVANLSALARTYHGFDLALSDRSVLFTWDPVTRRPSSAVVLADADGKALDSEAVTADRDGSVLIASETGPSVLRFARDGRLLGKLPVPDALRTAPAGRARTNGSFEGLAMQPDGRTLVASMEDALTGDGPDWRRFQTWSRGAVGGWRLSAQYAYRADPGMGVSDITPVRDGRLLVLERSLDPARPAVRLLVADLRGATDVSAAPVIEDGSPVEPVRKTLLADIAACPSLGAPSKVPLPNPLLDNIEGLMVTGGHPRLGLRVLMVSDNNESALQTTRVYDLRVVLPRLDPSAANGAPRGTAEPEKVTSRQAGTWPALLFPGRPSTPWTGTPPS
ncbi:esterase-like activity of phytase family protein [Streptomyces sp. NPDC013178]|uniref:esterase-like activity of phytase family protein n=1 Tax=Streptomyces sp. NPDC013178 TaxID=3155118 RepID=UPI0033F2AE1D